MNVLKTYYRTGFVVAFVCIFAIGVLVSKEAGTPDAATTDEYAVYAAAMEEAVGGRSYVVISTTSTHDKPEKLDSALNFPIEFEKAVTDDLVNDFKTKNQKSHPITQQFPKDVHVTLISENEEHELLTNSTKDGWAAFYEKYPGRAGITRLSRVGFNQKGDIAVVYVGNVRSWETGHGAYLLLQKIEGKWKVITQTRGWIT
jgi:hypothetical protein